MQSHEQFYNVIILNRVEVGCCAYATNGKEVILENVFILCGSN